MRKLAVILLCVFAGVAFGQSTHSVTATWGASPTAATDPTVTYNIYRSTSNCTAPNLQKIASVAAGVLTYTDTTVAAGTTYCYGVTAANANGESSPVNGVAVVPSGAAPQPPVNLNLVPKF